MNIFKHLFLPCAALVIPSLPSHAALLEDYDLPGEQVTTVWTNLSSSNSGLTPSSGSGNISVGSPGFQASAGFYSFMGDYSITVAKTALSWDAKTVVLQLEVAPNPDFAWPYSGGPLLSYNGGSQNLPTSLYGLVGSEFRPDVFGGTTFYTWAFQWDLSAISGISSVSLFTPISVHTSTIAAQIDVGDTYAQVVPEPSTWALLGLGSLSFVAVLRRRKLS